MYAVDLPGIYEQQRQCTSHFIMEQAVHTHPCTINSSISMLVTSTKWARGVGSINASTPQKTDRSGKLLLIRPGTGMLQLHKVEVSLSRCLRKQGEGWYKFTRQSYAVLLKHAHSSSRNKTCRHPCCMYENTDTWCHTAGKHIHAAAAV